MCDPARMPSQPIVHPCTFLTRLLQSGYNTLCYGAERCRGIAGINFSVRINSCPVRYKDVPDWMQRQGGGRYPPSGAIHPCTASDNGDVPKVGYFRDIPDEFKIKSLYSNDLILNIASKSKETVQKLKFLHSPVAEQNHVHPWTFCKK